MKAIASKTSKFIAEHRAVLTTVLLVVVFASLICFGEGGTDDTTKDAAKNADQLWNDVSELIQKWVTRLGGVVLFVGGIMFALGWKSHDAEQKSNGISTMVAGGIVIAIAGLASQFF